MKNTTVESGFVSICKHNESICGDFSIIERQGENTTAVLSDGLGSGVKANILATLSAKILSTLTMSNMSIEECVHTVAATLPVCKVRHLAYATFSMLRINGRDEAYLAQFDNPTAILLRDGKSIDYDRTCKIISGKEVYESSLKLQLGDMLILITDGVTAAGIGKTMTDGWGRDNVVKFVEEWYTPDISPQRMASILIEACQDLYLGSPDDDTTALIFQLRERRVANIMIGPPEHKEDDNRILRLFFAKQGMHIVCGGTTAKTVSAFLNKPILPTEDMGSPEVPPTAHIDGVDLVTEGVITLGKVLELAKLHTSGKLVPGELKEKTDGASRIAKMLFEDATDINFFAGQAINPAHQEGGMGIDFHAKLGLIKALEEELVKMGKYVKISMC